PAQHLVLARAQQRTAIVRTDADLVDDGVLHVAGQERPARGDRHDRAAELVRGGVAQEASGRAERQELVGPHGVHLTGHQDESGPEPLRRTQLEQPLAVERFEAWIDECDVGSNVTDEGKRLARISGLGRKLQLWALTDHAAHRIAEQRLAIDDASPREPATRTQWSSRR